MEMNQEWVFAFNNKCAKFTGWDYNFDSLYHPSYEFAKAVGIGQGAWSLNALRFHSNWNWIMEVCIKLGMEFVITNKEQLILNIYDKLRSMETNI